MHKNCLRLSFLTLLFAAGCADSGSPHGVDPSAVLDDLDDDQVVAVCEDVYQRPLDAFVPSVRQLCTLDAVIRTALVAGSVAVCEAHLDDCLADPPVIDPAEEVDPAWCPTEADLLGCELTVGEVDACTAARVAVIEDAWDFSCADLDASEPAPDLDALPECEHLEELCPEIFATVLP